MWDKKEIFQRHLFGRKNALKLSGGFLDKLSFPKIFNPHLPSRLGKFRESKNCGFKYTSFQEKDKNTEERKEIYIKKIAQTLFGMMKLDVFFQSKTWVTLPWVP